VLAAALTVTSACAAWSLREAAPVPEPERA
jgi:hypothetical protein